MTLCVNARDDSWVSGMSGFQIIHEFAHLCGWRHGGGNGVPDPNTNGYPPYLNFSPWIGER